MQVLLDRNNGVSEHIYDQSKPHEYAARQVEQAIEKIEFICNDKGKILPTVPANIRIALLKLGVSVRYDQFADRTLLDGLPGYGPALEDAAVNHLWLQFMERLQFSPNLELVRIVVDDTARLNGFHPVRDYLDSLAVGRQAAGRQMAGHLRRRGGQRIYAGSGCAGVDRRGAARA